MKQRKQKNKKYSCSFFALVLAILLFVPGVGMFLYPTVSNYFAEKKHRGVIRESQNQFEDAGKEDLSAEWEKAEIYNENLAGDPVRDAFVPGSGYALPEN